MSSFDCEYDQSRLCNLSIIPEKNEIQFLKYKTLSIGGMTIISVGNDTIFEDLYASGGVTLTVKTFFMYAC